MGNFMNSEILGKPTHTENGVVFARIAEQGIMSSIGGISKVEAKKGTHEPLEDYVPIEIDITFEDPNILPQKITEIVEIEVKNALIALSSYNEPNIHEPGRMPIRYNVEHYNDEYVAIVETYGIARHPAQLYESIYCLLLFMLLFLIWNKWKAKTPEGLIFGLFLIILWSLRFVDEFFKENQESFEDDLPINMGQILSIPLVLLGIFILIRTWLNQKRSLNS